MFSFFWYLLFLYVIDTLYGFLVLKKTSPQNPVMIHVAFKRVYISLYTAQSVPLIEVMPYGSVTNVSHWMPC